MPQTGTWLLEKGERVTSAKLDATLERLSKERRGAASNERRAGRSSAVINQTIQVTGTLDNRTQSQIAAESARQQRLAGARLG